MSKECPRCGYVNGDDHYFCQQCSEPLDSNVRVIMGYEKMRKTASPAPRTAPKKDDDEDFVFVKKQKKKQSHAVVWAVLAVVVIGICVAAYLLLR